MAIDLLLISVTSFHFIAANLAVGGPIVALWLARRGGRGDAEADRIGRRLLRVSLIGLYVAIALGVITAYGWWRLAPLNVERAVRALPRSRFEFGVLELVFSAICWEIWLRLWSGGSRRRLGWWLGFLGATNVVYHFPTLFAVLVVLSERPAQAPGTVRFVSMLVDPEVLGRTMHFIVASLAVAGATTMQLFVRVRKDDDENDDVERLKRRGAQIALTATLLQWPIGITVLLTLPEASRLHLLGGDPTAAGLFGLSLVAVVVLMHHLAGASFGHTSQREARAVLMWLGVTIVFMTAVRQYARKPLYPAPPVAIMTTPTGQAHHDTTSYRHGSRTNHDHRFDDRFGSDDSCRLRV